VEEPGSSVDMALFSVKNAGKVNEEIRPLSNGI
jgi:hypothetical protein